MTPRAMTDTDRRYVVPTWALSAKYGGLERRDRFRLVDRLLDEGAPCIVLAHGSTVHAWACGAGDALHYAYVPPELRGKGLARRVISHVLGGYADCINVTHEWPGASRRFRFAPHLLHREAA